MSLHNGATPVIAQYLAIKQQYHECLVFFQMGDFYELFFDDARTAAQELDIVLTFRGQYLNEDIPMCGVPVHNYTPYTERLLKKGFKIAVCEQTESPVEAKKRGYKAIVDRQVTRILTPGTLVEDHLLEAKQDNFLAALSQDNTQFCIFLYDMSTGKMLYTSDVCQNLQPMIQRYAPSELIYHQDTSVDILNEITLTKSAHCISNDISIPPELQEFFDHLIPLEQHSLSLLISYLQRTQCGSGLLFQQPTPFIPHNILYIDNAGQKNLEIFQTLSGEKKPTLFWILDQCVTSVGSRLLFERLNTPITDISELNHRYDCISFFMKNISLAQKLCDILKKTSDINRILGRLKTNKISPADLGHIRQTLSVIYTEFPELHLETYDDLPSPIIHAYNNLCLEFECYPILSYALKKDLPITLKYGDFIREGFDTQLDEYRNLKNNTQHYILNLEAEYRQLTGVTSLKIKHNNLIGYHIDVSAGQAERLMNFSSDEISFTHKQTLATSVRFTTPKLVELEKKITEASACFDAREKEIFIEVCQKIDAETTQLIAFSQAIASFDLYSTQGIFVSTHKYTCPKLVPTKTLMIKNGRHPVIEILLKHKSKAFIPNDVSFKTGKNHTEIWLVTGPNMGGKSTYLRQNALMIIMAQAGFFVPADTYEAGIFDKIFSRVGASDNLAEGKSTFMTEMSETAIILSQATSKSFVILDELGRGTSTYDGLAIAWGTLKYLSETLGAIGLFATHYHELTEMIYAHKRIGNLQVTVSDYQGEIIFLHKIIQGAAKNSYGLHVAKLAGLPLEVLQTAQELLTSAIKNKGNALPKMQEVPLFPMSSQERTKKNPIYELIEKIDLHYLSPIEAFALIEKIKQELSEFC